MNCILYSYNIIIYLSYWLVKSRVKKIMYFDSLITNNFNIFNCCADNVLSTLYVHEYQV